MAEDQSEKIEELTKDEDRKMIDVFR